MAYVHRAQCAFPRMGGIKADHGSIVVPSWMEITTDGLFVADGLPELAEIEPFFFQ